MARRVHRTDTGGGGKMTTNPDDLIAWIADLRARVARGELGGLGRVELDGGIMLTAQLAARILLADLDHFDDLTPTQRRDLSVRARREALLRDLTRLRKQIG